MTAVMDPSMEIMFQNVLIDLYAGAVNPIDREILAYSPLPSDIVDPYAAQDVDPENSMNLTYSAMTAWIEEAKKANYFSKHFVTLSKMIMNGTTTMARGLVTLHQRGKSIEGAPMSIGDLISLSSYHFRKSYLGVMQTMKSHPEISERLLLNQLGWCNTLMRLYKTKEKLAQQVSGVKIQESEDPQDPELMTQDSKTAAIDALPASKERGIDAAVAFTEPGAFSAPRAYSSYDRSPVRTKSARSLSTVDDTKMLSANTEEHQAAESEKGFRDQDQGFSETDSHESPADPGSENCSAMINHSSETPLQEDIQKEVGEENITPENREKTECLKDGGQKSPDEDAAERSENILTDADFPRLTRAYRSIQAFLNSS